MPELPEVETVRRGLEPALAGRRFASVEQRRRDLRFPFPERFAERLAGRTVVSLARRAKYLLAALSGDEVLVMHLGMTGRFLVEAGEDARTPGAFHAALRRSAIHDHVVFRLDHGPVVTYNDARRFGFMTLLPAEALPTHPLFARLGREPLDPGLDGAALARLFAGKSTPLKAALLDQTLIAGLGNIYACEALHRAGLSPFRAAGSVAGRSGGTTRRAARLADAISGVLAEAVEAGGSSLRDYAHTDGSLGLFQHRFSVYDREGVLCPRPGCGGAVKRVVQAGRSTFYCERCQG